MSLILDAIVLAIIVLCIVIAAHRGFVRTLIDVVGCIAAVVIAISFGNVISGEIYDRAVSPQLVRITEETAASTAQDLVDKGFDAIPNIIVSNAEKFGFSSAAELKKQLVRLNSEKSNKTVQLMEAAGYIHRQCEPVYTQAKKAGKFYEMAKASFEADFVRSFRAWSQKHVSDISFYPGKQQQMFVRCKIDGQQQMGKELNRNDAELLRNTKIGSETKDLALKAFKEDIIEAMGQTQKQSVGLKR